MRSRLLKAFRMDCDFVEKQLRTTGSVSMMFVIRGHGGEVIPMIVSGGTKEEAYRMVRLAAIAHDAEAVSSIAEAWTLPPDAAMSGVQPSQSERRIEVVAVQLVTRDEAAASMRDILRDAEGRFIGLGPERIKQAVVQAPDFGGLIAEVVPPHRPDSEARAAARELLDNFTSGTFGTA
jgi:hypothetical protein